MGIRSRSRSRSRFWRAPIRRCCWALSAAGLRSAPSGRCCSISAACSSNKAFLVGARRPADCHARACPAHRAYAGTRQEGVKLFRLDSGRLDDRAITFDAVFDQRLEVVGRAADDRHAVLVELGQNVGALSALMVSALSRAVIAAAGRRVRPCRTMTTACGTPAAPRHRRNLRTQSKASGSSTARIFTFD